MSTGRFELVDALRGLAALAVVMFHAAEGGHITGLLAIAPAWVGAAFRSGALGVAVFFALSGFVIAHSVYNERATLAFIGRFMLRRSIRLDPPYWFAIMLTVALAGVSAVVSTEELPSIQPGRIVAHLFYLQEILGFEHVSDVFWTLCIEVQLYIVYVLLLAFARNNPDLPLQGRRTASVLIGAALVSLLWPLGILSVSPLAGLFLPMWHGFLVDAGAYWAFRNPQATPVFLGFAVLLLSSGVVRGNAFTVVCAATAFTLWLAAATGLGAGACRWRWFGYLGAVSYSLYLTHNPITGATFRIGYMLTGRSPAWEAAWLLASTAVCIGFAAAV